jgi:hypothetical protein
VLIYCFRGNNDDTGILKFTPEEVVEKYTQAILKFDFQTAEQLSTAENTEYLESISQNFALLNQKCFLIV